MLHVSSLGINDLPDSIDELVSLSDAAPYLRRGVSSLNAALLDVLDYRKNSYRIHPFFTNEYPVGNGVSLELPINTE
ncbi:hypothetical protein RB195_000983 [Necator americanus]|uniref:F-box domain-containing protein n=1 Tax=Necator americanus TaxID=51031 RepID=A0ABR1DC67_NECAM